MVNSHLKIADCDIGTGYPCFIIAEAGVNHNGSLDMACQMVEVAAHAGADAIKFQTFKAEKLTTANAPKAAYQVEATGVSGNQLEMLRKLELSYSDFKKLFDECRKNNILFLSTPFDEDSTDFLDSLNMEAFKISSGEVTNLPFLAHIARKGRPVILSTGMSYLNEVDLAVRVIQSNGNHDLVLLHCTSSYPADPADVNLRAMLTLGQAFQVPVGFSDHTMGIEIPLAAIAMGASVIEKHFTLNRSLPGPDHQASLEPSELDVLVKGIRKVEASLGHGRKEPVESEVNTAAVARKSIVARVDIPKGTVLNDAHLIMMRPGTGLPSAMLEHVIGRMARVDIPAGALILFEMVT
jgi:N,N'-diacetyllegionaminate synthase